MALHKGWDVIYTEPGTHEEIRCPVCNEKMTVERNVTGPTGFAESMAKKGHLHDTFHCENANEKWHKQVRRLKMAVLKTPSGKLAAMYQEEIAEILESKQPTKDENVYSVLD